MAKTKTFPQGISDAVERLSGLNKVAGVIGRGASPNEEGSFRSAIRKHGAYDHESQLTGRIMLIAYAAEPGGRSPFYGYGIRLTQVNGELRYAASLVKYTKAHPEERLGLRTDSDGRSVWVHPGSGYGIRSTRTLKRGAEWGWDEANPTELSPDLLNVLKKYAWDMWGTIIETACAYGYRSRERSRINAVLDTSPDVLESVVEVAQGEAPPEPAEVQETHHTHKRLAEDRDEEDD